MLKKERVKRALLRQNLDKIPIFTSSTPQFIKKAIHSGSLGPNDKEVWDYYVNLDLDVIQIDHPSFYPVKVMELSQNEKYVDEFGRTHIISGYYDNYCAPFPLQPTKKIDIPTIKSKWESFEFPDPLSSHWFDSIDNVHPNNESLDDPLSIWAVINGPFEPTWQLLSDGWPEFFILYRRDPDLARTIIEAVTDYCIKAGQGMIKHGANAVRIGDDYALNEGLMTSPKIWEEIIYPAHKRLVAGLKKEGGQDFPVILHSDGNISDILNLLGDGGINALNPIQPDALDFGEVVESIGHKLSMTGAFDLRLFLKPLNKETEKMLRDETKRLFSIVNEYNSDHKEKTGLSIGPTHQVQPGSYVETFEKWVKIVHELNKA